MREFTIQTKAGKRDAYCLELGIIAVWLIDVDTAKMKNRPAAEKIKKYKLRLIPIATQEFFQTMAELQKQEQQPRAVDIIPTIPSTDAVHSIN